jgi:Transposase, Mutator family
VKLSVLRQGHTNEIRHDDPQPVCPVCWGLDVGDSEDGAFWTAFLRSLKARGLHGVQLVISDAHTGLKAAIGAVMAGPAGSDAESGDGRKTSVVL